MKKINLLLFLSLVLNFCFAQNRTKIGDTTRHVTITYDFLSKDPLQIMRWSKNGKLQTGSYDVRKLYYGDKINFRVRVNPFLYDVKVNGTNLFDNSPLDTAFIKTFTGLLGNTGSKTSVPKQVETTIEIAKNALTDPPKSNIKSDSPKDRKFVQTEVSPKNILKEKDVDSLKIEAESKYRNGRKDFILKTHFIDSFFNRYQDEKIMLENILILALADYKEYDSIISEINTYIQFMQGKPSLTIDSLKQSTDFYLRYYQRAAKNEANDLRFIFQEMAEIDKTFEISTFKTDSILYHYYNDIVDSLQKEQLTQFSRAYMTFLQNLANRSFFEKNYVPEFAVADSFRFQIEIKPSARARDFISLYKVPVRDTAFKPYTLPVKRFLKLNISVGLAFMFGRTVPSTYYYSIPKDQIKDDDTVLILKGDSKASVIPRIGLFTHLYWTNASWVKPAITFGISTNPADPSETAYMGGLSLILGQNRRMVVSGGVALANTDVLKSRYKVNEIRKKSFYTGVEETDLIEKKLRFGGFFGISYNF